MSPRQGVEKSCKFYLYLLHHCIQKGFILDHKGLQSQYYLQMVSFRPIKFATFDGNLLESEIIV